MDRVELHPFWESLLKRYVKKTFYAGTRKSGFADRGEFTEGDYRFFCRGIARLNEGFTRERGSLPRNYLNQKDLRSGYLLYFLPVNALKVASLLTSVDFVPLMRVAPVGRPTARNEMSTDGRNRSQDPLHGQNRQLTILDIGSGPGTGMVGGMILLEKSVRDLGAGDSPIQVEWILVDQNRQALQDAGNLHREITSYFQREKIPVVSTVRTIVADIGQGRIPKVGPADLILCLNTLSELSQDRRFSIIDRLLRKSLKGTGRLLVMEPALQRTTRELMELHDQIILRESGVVLAPCLHQAACPMLSANRRDWCHTYIEWQRPAYIERFDRLVGIRKDYLKCSYLVLKNCESKASPLCKGGLEGGRDNIWRVVSGHLNSKGKSELLLCGPGGLPRLQRVVRLDRDQSPQNRLFDDAQRGELIQMTRCSRMFKETMVEKASDLIP